MVASLWEVDDRASAELMRRFYTNLLGSGRTAPQALRLAQLSMLRDTRGSAAVHWAGFVFSGDWRIVPWGGKRER